MCDPCSEATAALYGLECCWSVFMVFPIALPFITAVEIGLGWAPSIRTRDPGL